VQTEANPALLHLSPDAPYAENSRGSDKKEFYLQGNVCSDLAAMQTKIKCWRDIWNGIRLREALNYLTPNECFLAVG